jgi:hypothetical protein
MSYNLKGEFSGKERLFGTFIIKPSDPKEKVEIVKIRRNSILAEVSRNGNIHYELYWFITQPGTNQKCRDDLFREGYNVVIKIFSFGCGGAAEGYQDFFFESPDFDPRKYCKLTYDLPSFLRDNPREVSFAPKFLL